MELETFLTQEEIVEDTEVLGRRPQQKKSYEKLGVAWKYEIKKQIANEMKELDKFLKVRNLEISYLVLQKKGIVICNKKMIKKIEIIEKQEQRKVIKKNKMKDKADVKRVLMEKDKINLADHKYHNFRTGCNLINHLPSINSIKKCRKTIDSNFEYISNNHGYFVNIIQKMNAVLGPMIQKFKFSTDKPLIIKLSGDGLNVGRVNKLFALSFSVINDSENCNGLHGNFIIGLFKISSENFKELKLCLKEPIDKLLKTSSIVISEKSFNIKYYIGN